MKLKHYPISVFASVFRFDTVWMCVSDPSDTVKYLKAQMIASRIRLARILTLYDSMVHYNAEKKAAAQTPPPRCPKCGSHRTELIGTSEDRKIAYLRCAACGVRSEVPSREAVAV